MNLISIISRGYFSLDTEEGYVYYCVDLPEIKIAKDLSPKLSIKEQD
ncbi:MAG: hypothetical protein JRJ85_00670 [Deltaproteobacteria bacterium]|nr:hypothetical protein [Deltaproteobacteria bacterium]